MAKFVRRVKFEELEKNKVLRYAVERQLRLIGDLRHLLKVLSSFVTMRLSRNCIPKCQKPLF